MEPDGRPQMATHNPSVVCEDRNRGVTVASNEGLHEPGSRSPEGRPAPAAPPARQTARRPRQPFAHQLDWIDLALVCLRSGLALRRLLPGGSSCWLASHVIF